MDCLRKKSTRTLQHCFPIAVIYIMFFFHTYLPSYESHRAITLLHFNLVMALICLDLMLANMAAREFMCPNPFLLILTLPLIAFYLFKCSATTELYLSIFCVALAAGLYALRMTLLAIQFYDTTNKSFLFNTAPKIKSE